VNLIAVKGAEPIEELQYEQQ